MTNRFNLKFQIVIICFLALLVASTFANKVKAGLQQNPNVVYQEECGACHLVYPAKLLPEKGWNKILQNLDDHFGENAELENDTNQILQAYLAENSMQKGFLDRFFKNFPEGAPTRITKLSSFVRKHDEVPAKMVKDNPKVGSFSQCDKCHRGAARGDFEEDKVKIPGYSRWED